MGHLQGWPFGVARLRGAALGIRVALRLLLVQPLSQRWLLLPGRSNVEWVVQGEIHSGGRTPESA